MAAQGMATEKHGSATELRCKVRQRKEIQKVNERLAVLTAMEKCISEPLKDAKLDARDELEGLFLAHGVTQMRMDIDGEKVGTVSYTPPKSVPAIDPAEERTALEWLYENGLAELKPIRGWQDHFEMVGDDYVSKDTGEVVPWLYQSAKGGVSTVRLSAKPMDVLDMAAPLMQGGIAGLLGGEDVQHVPTA